MDVSNFGSDVKVAVIPAAGFGTRLLPATKVISKELFPIYNRPAIHITVSECVKAGIKEIILVLSQRKMDILRYFEKDNELESFLEEKGKKNLLAPLEIFKDVKIDYVIQEKQNGLGDAVLCAREKVGQRNFAVLLPDDIYILSDGRPTVSILIEKFLELRQKGEINPKAVLLLRNVPKEKVKNYGVVYIKKRMGNFLIVGGVVEKPEPELAPSRFAIVGRYVFSPEIFDWIQKEKPDEKGEIQLAGAIGNCSYSDTVVGVSVKGKWLDIGSPEGYVKANMFFAKNKRFLY
jgi:UTP--glucose-1-phosphate uridylyltransferase